MNRFIQKYWRHAAVMAVAVMAVVVVGFIKMPRHKAQAQTGLGSATSTVVFGLDVYGSQETVKAIDSSLPVQWQTMMVPSGGEGIPHRIYINASSFNTDFRVGIKICDPNMNNGTDPCHTGWTPWASDVANGAAINYSPIVGAGPYDGALDSSCGYVPTATLHNRMTQVSIAAQTRPIGTSGTGLTELKNVSLLLYPVEYDYNAPVDRATACYTPGMLGSDYYGITPYGGGGWSSDAYDRWMNASTDGFMIQIMANISVLNAVPANNNIPTSMNPGATITTGVGGGPLQITMKNTGNVSWPLLQGASMGSTSGSVCQVPVDGSSINNAPAATSSNWGKSCTINYAYSLSMEALTHATSSFTATPSIALATTTIPVTVTYVAPSSTKVYGCWPSYGGTLLYQPAMRWNPGLISNAFAMTYGGVGGCTVGYRAIFVPVHYEYSYGAPTSIVPNAMATFTLNSLTAPAAAGNYTETWQMESNGTPFGAPLNIPIQVGPSGILGTINVVSYATDTTTGQQIQVPATWIVSGPQTINQSVATSSATYGNLPLGNYDITHVGMQVPGMSLRNVHMVVAQNPRENMMTGFLAMLGEPFRVAHAQTVSVLQNGGSWFGNSATLGPSPHNVFTFGIQWQQNGLQHLACVSNACTLIPGAGSNQNGCTAVGQTCTGGGGQISASLSAYPSSGTVPLTSTVTATVVNGAAPYTYSFWQNCGYVGSDVTAATKQCGKPTVGYASVSSPTENATFTYNQIGSDTPLVIVNSGTNSVDAAATVTVNSPAGGCSPAGSTQSCTSAANACGQVNSGTETCSGGGVWEACSATVPSNDSCPVGPSSCSSFTASSTTILPGEYSTLSWTCTNVTSCSIDNGGGSGGATGISRVDPTSTTVYTLSCNGTSVTTTTVIVQNPGQIEINP